jgi:hypothetical protein
MALLSLFQSPDESADRLAICQLIDAYSEYADRRDALGQTGLFTDDAHFAVYAGAASTTPSQELHGRDSLAANLKNLNIDQLTTHSKIHSTIKLSGLVATGETYCIAHQVFEHDDLRSLVMAAIRYIDIFEKVQDIWYFAERKLVVDWIETHKLSWSAPSAPGPAPSRVC